jgi:hypothetical protein
MLLRIKVMKIKKSKNGGVISSSYESFLLGCDLVRRGDIRGIKMMGSVCEDIIDSGIEFSGARRMLNDFGLVSMRAGKYVSAARCFKGAIKLCRGEEPSDAALVSRLAICYSNLGKYEDAVNLLMILLGEDLGEEHDEVCKILATVHFNNSRYFESLGAIQAMNDPSKYPVEVLHTLLVLNLDCRPVLEDLRGGNDKLNRCNLKMPMADPLNFERVFIPNDCGVGDLLCYLPIMGAMQEKEFIACVTPDQLGMFEYINPYSNISFVLDNNVGGMSYLPSVLLPAFRIESPVQPLKPVKSLGSLKGICTRGNPLMTNDNFRSLDPESDSKFRSLHSGAIDLTYGVGFNPSNWMETIDRLKDLKELISVDTGVVHLAGAMGIPTRVLVRVGYDWRYSRGPYWAGQILEIQRKAFVWDF